MRTDFTPNEATSNDHWEVVKADLSEPDVGTIWDLCISVEYDRKGLVQGLADWLGPPADVRLLDCACGSGFPSLDLHKMGYSVTCTDGSEKMLERFQINAEAAGVDLETVKVRWEELGGLFDNDFDVVMCRGCSFLYAGTFDDDADPDRSALERSLENFRAALRPGGRVYLDAPHEKNLGEETAEWVELPLRMIDGHSVEMRERISADRETRIRRWEVELSIDGTPLTLQRRCHYMPHNELLDLMRRCGFEDVECTSVSGENYAVFVGRKP